ncbi:unnamed protein product [Rotaria sp. Silwood2]|nr:unnamed protein product [Rotaria sp. Silwood2]CAF3381389.1 unnamed protein product [Rotaria sp. Silwood2]CAF3968835.1 unnamed protein product [Rotaria sp. Silwood2]CAF4552022.1 unnamed protein product [Rotaria sp. Silwood2]
MSVAPSYQQEPIPMMANSRPSFQPIPMAPQYKDHSVDYNNSFKKSQIATPIQNYNMYSQSNNSARTRSSMQSTKEFIQPSRMYSSKQPAMNKIYPYNSNQLYYPQKDVYPNDDFEQNDKSTSCCSRPLCLGFTRCTGISLFGIMIVVGAASLGGLIASAILYVQDSSTDSSWKVLGMVVCSAILIAILVALCIIICCYKSGRFGDNENENRLTKPEFNQESYFGKTNNYNQSYMSSIPNGIIHSTSYNSTNEDVIQVEDKQTNTETTMAPLRPRNFQCGVWPATNAYGHVSYRPVIKPQMIDRFIQTASNEIDQMIPQQNNSIIRTKPKTIILLPENRHQHDEEQYPSRFIEQRPRYNIVEKIIKRPKLRLIEEYVEFDELPTNGRIRIGNGRNIPRPIKVIVQHVKVLEEPNVV